MKEPYFITVFSPDDNYSYKSYVLPQIGDMYVSESFEGLKDTLIVTYRILHPEHPYLITVGVECSYPKKPLTEAEKDLLTQQKLS